MLVVTDHVVWVNEGRYYSNSPVNLYTHLKGVELIAREIVDEKFEMNSSVLDINSITPLKFKKRKSLSSLFEVFKYCALIHQKIKLNNEIILSGVNPITVIAWLCLVVYKKPYLFRIIGKGDLNIESIGRGALAYRILSKIYFLFTNIISRRGISVVVSKDIAKHYQINNYYVIPDTKINLDQIADKDLWRPKRLIFVGRLSREKNVELLIDSLIGISGIELVIVGDGSEREGLLKKLESSGIKYKYMGRLKHEETLKEIANSQYLVLSSKTEGLPNVIIEAFATGTPVISTNVGGISEILDDKINGYYITNDSEKNRKIFQKALNEFESVYREMRASALLKARNFTVEESRGLLLNVVSELHISTN